MKNYRNRYFYTLVELLMAMAIFAIISVIMMRFFSSAQQIWSKASQKNILYADARIALDIMTAELQNALYDNNVLIATEPNITPGIYPFWFEYKDFAEAGNPEPIFDTPVYAYAGDPVQLATYNKAYVTQLNFISATALKPNTNASNICEIKYIYLPVRLDNKTDDYPTGLWNIKPGPYSFKGGVLVRACTGDLTSAGVPNFNPATTACLYNFLLLPHDPAVAPTRVRDIFTRSSSENYKQIIDGIVDMKITCYTLVWNGTGYDLKPYNPMKHDGTIAALDPSILKTNAEIGTIVSGTPFPVAVKIDLYMLAERDLREWLIALNDTKYSAADRAAAANKIKNERMRCFSKTIYLSNSK